MAAGGFRRIDQAGEIAPGGHPLDRHAEHLFGAHVPADAIVGDGPLVGGPADRSEDRTGVDRTGIANASGPAIGRDDYSRLSVRIRIRHRWFLCMPHDAARLDPATPRHHAVGGFKEAPRP